MAGGQRLGGLDNLLEVANEVVDVLELAVLDVQGVATEPGPAGEQDPLASGASMVTSTATVYERLRMFGATGSGTSAQSG